MAHYWIKNSIALLLGIFSVLTPIAASTQCLTTGPYGAGRSGSAGYFDDQALSRYGPITSLEYRAGWWLDSLQVTYGWYASPVRGNGGGGRRSDLRLMTDEHIAKAVICPYGYKNAIGGLVLWTSRGYMLTLGNCYPTAGFNATPACDLLPGSAVRLKYIKGIAGEFLEQVTFVWESYTPQEPPYNTPRLPPRIPKPAGNNTNTTGNATTNSTSTWNGTAVWTWTGRRRSLLQIALLPPALADIDATRVPFVCRWLTLWLAPLALVAWCRAHRRAAVALLLFGLSFDVSTQLLLAGQRGGAVGGNPELSLLEALSAFAFGSDEEVRQLLPAECVAWRATGWCSPEGPRLPAGDLPCGATVQFQSGYCECEGGAYVSAVTCGAHAFTCLERCQALGRTQDARPLPRPMYCKHTTVPGRMTAGGGQDYIASGLWGSGHDTIAPEDDRETLELWNNLAGAVKALPPLLPEPLPGTRTNAPGGDWVLEGRHLPPASVAALRDVVRDYIGLVTPPNARDPSGMRVADSLLGTGSSGSSSSGGGRRLAARTHRPLPVRLQAAGQDMSKGEHPHGAANATRSTPVEGVYRPPAYQRGRGIVMVSGGLRYMVSAWISVAMLRRAGCTLPVEMWFPLHERPTPAMVAELRLHGVACRTFSAPDMEQYGYGLKAVAILLSSFEEVLFLDADNFAVRDPAVLFDSPEYQQYGMVLWRDYWDSNVAPELHEVLGLRRGDMPQHSFESGQMLIDKKRHWLGLRVALYLNHYHATFYDLFTDYFGWGDKETFYYAFLAAHEPVYYNPAPVGSVGLVRPFCHMYDDGPTCRDLFTGNTMVQYGLSENGTAPTPLFLHSNIEKWSLNLPDSFDDTYTRRWRLLQPEAEDFPAWSQRVLGVDLERFAYHAARGLRCAEWFDDYYASRLESQSEPADALLQPMTGLHTMVPGVEFHQLYRAGYGGEYGKLYERSQLDELLHALGRLDRTVLVHVKRVLRSHVWGGDRAVEGMQEGMRRASSALRSRAV